MCIVPEYNHESTYMFMSFLREELDRQERKEALERQVQVSTTINGWVLMRDDGAVWGTGDGWAFYIFVSPELAENVLSHLPKEEHWQIKYVGTVEK